MFSPNFHRHVTFDSDWRIQLQKPKHSQAPACAFPSPQSDDTHPVLVRPLPATKVAWYYTVLITKARCAAFDRPHTTYTRPPLCRSRASRHSTWLRL
ncbi:hypothetical protein BGY98DRAFT_944718 [Russula aff. rugulosa BPL654]|nr:hypothetical protein BGY98DRAFT_944718 [Russula aff. rugulosa BPL654]